MAKDLTVRVTLDLVLDRTSVGSPATLVQPSEAPGYALGIFIPDGSLEARLRSVWGARIARVVSTELIAPAL